MHLRLDLILKKYRCYADNRPSNMMNREELESIGHEVSHIRNYDIRISTIAVTQCHHHAFWHRWPDDGGDFIGRSQDDDQVAVVLEVVC